MSARVSIGLMGLTPRATVEALAPRIERAGFHALWLNDAPGGDSLIGLRAAAAVTETLRLGTGVIPVDRRPVAEFDLRDLPVERLTVGIGSGSSAGGLQRTADALTQLSAVTEARIVVGGLGPRMRRLAAEHSDGVLLNWLTPPAAAQAMDDLRRDANGRDVDGILYVRTIVDPAVLPQLMVEAGHYEVNPSYAANFERLGMRAMDATIQSPADLERYRGVVDEVVLRAITPGNSLADLEHFVDTAGGWLAS